MVISVLIKGIRLENILAFQNQHLPMAKLTLLAGSNSAGKSSILHSLAMLKQSSVAGILNTSWMLNGELVELGTGRDLYHAEPETLVGLEEKYVMRLSLDLESGTEDWVAKYENEADVLELLDSSEYVNDVFDTSGFQYLKADRIVPTLVFPKSHEAVEVRKSLGARGEHAPNFLRCFGDSTAPCASAYHPNAISNSLLDQTNAWIGEISSGTELSIKDVPDTDFVRIAYTRRGAQVHAPSQRATNVGFGLTYALPVIVAALSATQGSLLLIENPEAHLHPAGQAVVGRLCAMAMKGGAQVLIETHSDHVLNAIRLCVKKKEIEPGEVISNFFSRNENSLQPVVHPICFNEDGSLPEWPSGFFDQWDKDLDELLGF